MPGLPKSSWVYVAIGAALASICFVAWAVHRLHGAGAHANEITETLKNSTEAFAWACAGGFFLYKTVSGYLISNLSLSVTCQRQRANSGKDYLVVTASLKKGDRGAISLHEVIASVLCAGGKHETKPLSATRRLTSIKVGSDEVFRLKDSPARDVPLLNLPPGDETMFSAWFEVPSDDPATAEVTILAGWHWHGNTRYQWRASTVSLPMQPRDKATPTQAPIP
jgi:hypothetical protein